MNIPTNLKYTKDHEWVILDGEVATIGITDFAQSELGETKELTQPPKRLALPPPSDQTPPEWQRKLQMIRKP